MKKLILLLLLILFVTSPAYAWRTKGAAIVARSKADLKLFIDIYQSGDKKAAQSMLDQKRIFMTKENVKVYIIDMKAFGSYAKIRFDGSTQIWWTRYDFLTNE